MRGATPFSTLTFTFLLLPLLHGCSAVGTVSTVKQVATTALELTGLKKPEIPEVPDALKPQRNVSIKLHAGSVLNADASGRSLALVARLYKLRQANAFEQAPYEVFLDPQKEKDALGADLLEVKEVVLVPGQRFEATEKVSREAYFIGLVALYRSPAPSRWRLAFPAADAEKTGIIVGAHGCALTIGTGVTVTDNIGASQLLSPVDCK